MYGCTVSSFVTDGAANMVKLRKLVESKLDDIVSYSCGSHAANLIAKYICKLDRHQCTLNNITKIAKYFKYHALPNAWLRAKGGKSPVIGIDIRWNTYSDQIESYIGNHSVLLQVCLEHEGDKSLDAEICKYI